MWVISPTGCFTCFFSFFQSSCAHRDLHSFPTRRSSDLLAAVGSRRFGVARTAILARVLNGLGAVVMGLVAGPVALVAAYAVTYTLHGAGGPVHAALLHREASARNRATVLSMNSMVSFLGFSLTAALAGQLAAGTSTQVAMVVVGAFSILGAFGYRAARRAERARAETPEPVPVP